MSLRTSKALAAAALLIASFAVLKNIGYPLLWNDEGETAMFAERVLRFGYPKISDGKNVVYYLELKDKMAGRGTPGGAYLGSGWGHFYWGAIGALAARAADGAAGIFGGKDGAETASSGAGVYVKTALLRLPFALAGLGALVLAAAALAPLVTDKRRVFLFAAAFFLWEALSVSWALHMREMRYYALVCLLLAWLLYLAVRRHAGRMPPGRYAVLATAALILLLLTFPPAVIAAAGALGLGELTAFIRRRSLRKFLPGLAPLVATGAAAVVYAGVFRSARIAAGFAEMFPKTPERMRAAAGKLFAFFRDFESLWLIAAAFILGAAVAAVSWIRARRKGGAASGGRLLMDRSGRGLVGLSALILAYMLMHAALFIWLGTPYPFERYFIWLQPAAGLVLWLNAFALAGTLGTLAAGPARTSARAALFLGFAVLAALTAGERVPFLKARVYELFHRTVGPMDYAVGFVKRSFPDPRTIVIATNYEEGVLQYYLGSRVVIGFVGNNLDEDMALTPDVIILRKRPTYTNEFLRELLKRERYEYRMIGILDTTTNTSPEVTPGENSHRFRTVRTNVERWALGIHHLPLRRGEAAAPEGRK